jgi:long-chain fatty acid transport protein
VTGENASSNNHGNNRGPYYAPQIAYTRNNGAFSYGVGAFAQGGLGTEFGKKSFLSRTLTNGVDTGLEHSSRLLNLRIPFAGSYKVNDKLTVGASLDAVWTAMNLELLLDVTQVGALAADGRVTGSLVPTLIGIPGLSGAHFSFTKDEIVGGGVDAWGVGGKLGLTYQVAPSTRLGVAYNFKTNVGDLEGIATLSAVDHQGNVIPLKGDIKIVDFQNPAQFSIGVDHVINEQWTLVADYQRVFWEDVMENIDVAFVHGASGADINISLPQNYDDINIFTIGAEYRHSPQWSFRAGYSHADNAIPGDMLFAVIPAYLQDHLTGGFTYNFTGQDRVEFALSYAFEKELKNSSQPNTAAPITSSHSQVNAVVSYVHRF